MVVNLLYKRKYIELYNNTGFDPIKVTLYCLVITVTPVPTTVTVNTNDGLIYRKWGSFGSADSEVFKC